MNGTPLAKQDLHIDEDQFEALTKQFV